MPGNEVGDRVHNFFGQENLYQGQHQLQATDGTWPMLTDNTWDGSQRQFAAPFISNFKNYTAHQSANSEGGHGNLSPHMSDGFSHTQSNLGPEFSRSQAYNQQKALNGYMQGRRMLPTRQNEANILGGGMISDRKNLTVRDLTLQEAQSLDGPVLNNKTFMELETTDAHVSFDLFGGQQQMNGGHLNMVQPLRRQQSGMPDSQLVQQQTILSQIQGLQRQQQHQYEARHHGSINQVSSIMRQDTGNHSAAVSSSIPVNDVPNYSWQDEHVAGNMNWMHFGASPVIHGSASGLMSSSEQNHALQMMGMITQQIDQSQYGVHIPTARSFSGPNSLTQMDKPTYQQLSNPSNSFRLNKYTEFPDQSDMQDETSTMRQNFQGKKLFEQTSGQGSSGLNSENLHRVNSQPGNASMQESQGRQWIARRSETSNEKTEMQVTSSQYVSTLDPTEENFLYGSDDNLWDAFGRTATLGSGVANMLDGVVFDGGFSSMQSGTWSALMQSAVAETLSSTDGVREEWSDLSIHNTKSQNENQQHVSVSDSGKLLPIWVGGNLQTTATPKSESGSAPLKARRSHTSINYCGVSGFQEPGSKFSFEHGERLQTYPAQMPKFLEESGCLDRSLLQKPLAEGLQSSDNVNRGSGAEIKENNILGSWTSEQGIPLHKNMNQHGRQNGRNFIGSMSPDEDGNLKCHENQNIPSNPQVSHQRRAIHEEMSPATVMFKNDPSSNSFVEMSHTERAIELPQLPRCYDEGKWVHGDTAIPQSSAFSIDRESKHQYSGPHDMRKDVDSLMKKGHDFLGKYPHHLDSNNCLNKGTSEILEMGEGNRKENFSDGFHSSISNHTSAGGLGECPQSDVGEGRRLPMSKQKLTSNVGRKPSLTRKFQYHPMGDLESDAEPSNGTKHATHSHATAQEQFYGYKSHESGTIGQSKFDQADKNALEVDKGNGTTRGFGVPSKVDSFGNVSANDASPNIPPSSQNMLELLHKVDHPMEHGTTSHFSPANFNPSRMHGEERSGGPDDQTQQCQSSASHGFGLQLGPPSQPLSISDTALSSHKSSEAVHISAHTTSEIKGKVNSWLAPAASMKSNPSHQPLKGDFKYHTPCPSESLHSDGSIEAEPRVTNQYSRQADDSCNRIETSHYASVPDISGIVPQQKVDASHVQTRAQESDWWTTSQQGAFSKVSSNEWASVKTRQQCPQPLKSSHLLNSFQSDNNLEMNFSRPKVLNQVSQELVSSPSGVHPMNLQSFVGREQPVKESPRKQVSQMHGDTLLPSLSTLQGKESPGLYDAASTNPATTQRDYEVFGHSSRPNSTSDQQFSSLDQVKDIRTKVDCRNISEQRFKCIDAGMDSQEVASRGGQYLSSGLNNIVQEASTNHPSLSSRDSKLPTFSSQLGDSPNETGPCLDGIVLCQSKSQNLSISNNISCDRGDRAGISPQMAPLWFDRYGSLKNGQMFTVPGQENSTIKLMSQSLPSGTPSDCVSSLHSLKQPNSFVEKSLLDSTPKSSPLSLKEVCQSASDLLPSAVGNQSLVVRPQKRKTSTSELLPWHKEISLDSQRLQNISLADVEWAQAANRLIEKMEDEMEVIDDGQVLNRPKKRHILTTQLMQQLLRPPPTTFLSADANLQYESVVYLVARIASGDACSAVPTIGIETPSPLDSKNLRCGKLKTSAKIGNQLHKLMEEFLGRARKLENDFLRMEKGVSIPDLRVGCQDLEKFSVINRFAKFHSRGQVDVGEASSSYPTANSQRIYPQRYVTAIPMPKNLPDGVQCLSL